MVDISDLIADPSEDISDLIVPPSGEDDISDLIAAAPSRDERGILERNPIIRPIAEGMSRDYEEGGVLGAALEGLKQSSPAYRAYEFLSNPPPVSPDVASAGRGILSGLEQTMVGNASTFLESKLPAGRLFVTDDEGLHLWKPTHEALGVSEQAFDEMSDADRRKLITQRAEEEADFYYKDLPVDKESAVYKGAEIAGMFMDPSFAIPISTSSKVATMATGGTLGGVDAALWSAAQEGDVDPQKVLIGAALGGAVPAAIKGAGELLDRAVARRAREGAQKTVMHLQDEILSQRASGKPLMQAYQDVLARYNMSPDDVRNLTLRADTKLDLTSGATPQRALEELASRKPAIKAGVVDQLIQPISDRIRDISPRIWQRMIDTERRLLEDAHRLNNMTNPFLDVVRKMPRGLRKQVKLALIRGDRKDLDRLFRQSAYKDLRAKYKMYREALDEMYEMRRKAGYKAPKVEEYTPRIVQDIDLLKGSMSPSERTRVEGIIQRKAKEEAARGKAWTKADETKVIDEYLQGFYDAKGQRITPSSEFRRKQKNITIDNVDAYADPWVAVPSYFKESLENSYRRGMFGPSLKTKGKAKGAAVDPEDLDASIGTFLRDEISKGNMTYANLDEMKKLLRLRYEAAHTVPWKSVQGFKNIAYASLLGNPVAALTQVGDLFLAAYKHGLVNTMKALFGHRYMDATTAGLLENLAEEFVSTGPTARLMRASFKYGGFQPVDKLGKTALMNGAIHKYTNVFKKGKLRTESRLYKDLVRRYADAYGDEFPLLLEDLKILKANPKGAVPERVKTLAFAELSDIQPVSMLEMPEHYIKHPNGRLLYMLRTFTLKHINLMRKEIFREARRGNIKHAMLNAARLFTLFTAGGATSQVAKQMLMGEEPNMEEIWFDSLLANTGILNRYTITEASRSPSDAVIGLVAPPLNIFDSWLRAGYNMVTGEEISENDQRKMLKSIPLFGPLLSTWIYGVPERD